jgi:mannose-6-phosphate isomerase-like protein (cupin superfamily)
MGAVFRRHVIRIGSLCAPCAVGQEPLLPFELLEAYLLGTLGPEERVLVERALVQWPKVRLALAECERRLEEDARGKPHRPAENLRNGLLQRLDGMQWTQDVPGLPPLLHEGSSVSDFAQWLNDPTICAPQEFDDPYVVIIDPNEARLCGVVWVRRAVPLEEHTTHTERFLVVEGYCTIHLSTGAHALHPGAYFCIPPNTAHHVTVDSAVPCKIVVQRVVVP